MGRITVFTSNDILSQRVKSGLTRYGLPYKEIDLTDYPSKLDDLQKLTSRVSVPQVFFNTRFIGGIEATFKELRRWEKKSNETSILQKYKEEIESLPLENTKFELPTDLSPVPKVPYVPARLPMNIELPDKTMTTVIDITVKLKNSLPSEQIKLKKSIYFKCFSGRKAVETFTESMRISVEEAIAFGQRLQNLDILHRIDAKRGFEDCPDAIYRLEYDRRPDILNSFCTWKNACKKTCTELVQEVDDLFKEIEAESIEERNGKVSYRSIRQHEKFPIFEHAVCEFQKADMTVLDRAELLAFALNMYVLMTKYALVKLGIPTNEHDRLSMLTDVKFNVGGYDFSFQEWMDGVLRGNSKGRFTRKTPFSLTDSRRKFVVQKPDARIHFVVNHGPYLGSRTSFPFARFTADNVENELEMVANLFFEDDTNFLVKAKSGKISISKPLMWQRDDFGKSDLTTIVGAFSRYIHGIKKFELKKALQNYKQNCKIEYVDPDYTRNISEFLQFDQVQLDEKVKGLRALFRRFQPARYPENELLRLSTLHGLQILDTLPEERFDRLTKMAQETFNVPLVFVSLVDQNRQWFKSKQWACPDIPEASETGRDISFCGHAIHNASDEILCILDATNDDRFADNPIVTGPLSVRFYAGCPLSVPSQDHTNVNIGTLCIIDRKPRTSFSDEEQEKLRKYAKLVCDEIVRQDLRSRSSLSTVDSSCAESVSSDYTS